MIFCFQHSGAETGEQKAHHTFTLYQMLCALPAVELSCARFPGVFPLCCDTPCMENKKLGKRPKDNQYHSWFLHFPVQRLPIALLICRLSSTFKKFVWIQQIRQRKIIYTFSMRSCSYRFQLDCFSGLHSLPEVSATFSNVHVTGLCWPERD